LEGSTLALLSQVAHDGNCDLNFLVFLNSYKRIVGSNKYQLRSSDLRILEIIGTGHLPPLVSAAYASSTWNKIASALHSFKNFEIDNNLVADWPLSKDIVSRYIHWAAFGKNLSTSTIIAYMSHIKLVHKLKNLNYEPCKDFAFKSHIRGLKNLNFMHQQKLIVRRR